MEGKITHPSVIHCIGLVTDPSVFSDAVKTEGCVLCSSNIEGEEEGNVS